MPRKIVLILLASAIVAGCGPKDDVTLTRIRHTGNGPDEFSIIPSKPLQTPEDFSVLPQPTPGAANLVDQNPLADGVVAFGGNPNAIVAPASGIGAGDGGLVNHANRYGAIANVRETLAEEDKDTRRRHGRQNFLPFGFSDDYTSAYRRQWLDAYSEELRMRKREAITPAAPPAPRR